MSERAAIYCRISEKDVDYDKVEIQEKNLRKLAKDSGYVVVDVFKDDGISAFAANGKLKARPDWEKLATGVAQRKYDVVLAVAPDRLARNVGTGDEFLGLCAKFDVKLHTKSAGVVDPSDPHAKALAGVMNVFGELDVAVRMSKLRDRLEDETSQGKALWGRRPYGYASLRDGGLVKDEAARIQRATQDVIDGTATLYSIAKSWNQAGLTTTTGRPWSYQTIRQLLTRPRNARYVVRHGEIVPGLEGNWEQIIDKATYSAVVQALTPTDSPTSPNRERRWLCSNIASCGVCGAPLRSSSATIKGKRFMYYRCSRNKSGPGSDSRRHTSVRVEELDALVRKQVVAAYVMAPHSLLPKDSGDDLSAVYAERQELVAALDSLTSLGSLKQFSPATLAKRAEGFNKRIRELDSLVAEARVRSAHAAMTAELVSGLFKPGKISLEGAAKAAKALGERFDGLPLAKRRQLVERLLVVTVNPGRKPGRVDILHKIATSLNDDNALETVAAI